MPNVVSVIQWIGGTVAAAFVALWIVHRHVWRTGQQVRKTISLSREASGGAEPKQVTFTHIAGDLSTSLVVKEMFEDYAYFKNGVELPSWPDAAGRPPLIIDVGANIGLFALAVGTHAGMRHGFDILSFEIVPLLAEIAEKNVTPLNNGSDRRARVVRHGLSGARGDLRVTFEPWFTAGSTTHKESILSTMAGTSIINMITAGLHDMAVAGRIPMRVAKAIGAGLAIPLINVVIAVVLGIPMAVWILLNHLTRPSASTSVVDGHVERLSDALAAAHEDDTSRPIAMLKIDVEGAEWEVLRGMDDATWARVQQTVIEVHDLEGRVDRIRALLEGHGFVVEIGVEELAMHEILRMSTIFARRPRPLQQR